MFVCLSTTSSFLPSFYCFLSVVILWELPRKTIKLRLLYYGTRRQEEGRKIILVNDDEMMIFSAFNDERTSNKCKAKNYLRSVMRAFIQI